jgi:hypothetical protein
MRTRLLLTGAALLAALTLTFVSFGQSWQQRYIRLDKETTGHGEWRAVRKFETYHDTQSGVEFVCAFGDDDGAMSCFLTGRSWK